MTGRGVVDMKGQLALHDLQHYSNQESRIKLGGDLIFAGVIDE